MKISRIKDFLAWYKPQGGQAVSYPAAILDRAFVGTPDWTRLWHAFYRARYRNPTTLGFIGGSITQGGNASRRELRYADLVKNWWNQRFFWSTVHYWNAGIGGTGSNYGAHRAWDHVLKYTPDVLFVEFAVNDDNDRYFGECLEGLVRQALALPNRPAVVLIYEQKQDGSNAQEWHTKVGAHYGLPMVSVRDALWPEIEAGRATWKDYSDDHIHPNDKGHRATADCIIRVLERGVKSCPKLSMPPPVEPSLPAPLLTDLYGEATFMPAPTLRLDENRGWGPGKTSWGQDCLEATAPGSVVSLTVPGTVTHLLYMRSEGDMGIAQVQVDGGAPMRLDAWTPSATGINFCIKITEALEPGPHRVELRLSQEKADQSTGHRFQLIGVMSAGRGTRQFVERMLGAA